MALLFKPLVILFTILILAIGIASFLVIKYFQVTDFVNDMEIEAPQKESDHNFTAPEKGEVKSYVFFSCYLAAPMYRNYINRIGLQGNEKVLDFGSGAGAEATHLARILSEGGGQLTCLDISETWLKVAKERLKEYNNVDFILGDVTQLDIPENSYDAVVIHFVLHDINAQVRNEVVKKLAYILKPGGKIFIRDPASESHGMPKAEIEMYMDKNGLETIQSESKKILGLFKVSEGVFRKP